MTGMTGAGRSTAAKELEDLGYYVVDNLPPSLLRQVVRPGRREPRHDASRSRSWSTSGPGRSSTRSRPTWPSTRWAGVRRCCSSTPPMPCSYAGRRPPGAPTRCRASGRLIEGIRRERTALADLRADADLVIDTSDLNVHQLTDRIDEFFGTPDTTRLKVTVISFGFKYGIPIDADYVADMRFLPNPFWIPKLRGKTGRAEDVSDYVLGQDGRPRVRRQLRPAALRGGRGLSPRGQALHVRRHRLHRRQAPQRRDDRGDLPAAARGGVRRDAGPPRPRA